MDAGEPVVAAVTLFTVTVVPTHTELAESDIAPGLLVVDCTEKLTSLVQTPKVALTVTGPT